MSNYTDIGYDKNLNRGSSDSIESGNVDIGYTDYGSNPSTEGNQGSQESINTAFDLPENVIIGDTINDAWITNFIKSKNYKPGVNGFMIDGISGDVEFGKGKFRGDITGASGTFSGTLIGGSLHIPDTTSANSFHVDSDGNIWSGATTLISAKVDKFAVENDGTLYAYNGVIAGTLTIGGRLATIIGGAINGDGDFTNELINTNLDTDSKTILSDFTFSPTDYSGAFKTGTITWDTTTGAITGGTGGVFNKSGLIFAVGGTPTITLDGITGSATFAGTLSAAAGTLGSITAGTLSGVSISIGTGDNIFKADASGIYLGDATFADAPFRVNMTGQVYALDVVASNLQLYETVVDASGNGDYLTVHAAITAGKKRIFIRNGTYAEPSSWIITTGMEIIGESKNGVIVSFAYDYYGIYINGYTAGSYMIRGDFSVTSGDETVTTAGAAGFTAGEHLYKYLTVTGEDRPYQIIGINATDSIEVDKKMQWTGASVVAEVSNLVQNFSIKNMTFTSGIGGTVFYGYYNAASLFYINCAFNGTISNINIKGYHNESFGSDISMFQIYSSSKIVIDNIYCTDFSQNYANVAADMFFFYIDNKVYGKNITITNCIFDRLICSANSGNLHGIYELYGTIIADSNRFTGLYALGTGKTTTGVYFYGSGSYGCFGNRIVNNDFCSKGTYISTAFYLEGDNCDSNIISNNIISSGTSGFNFYNADGDYNIFSNNVCTGIGDIELGSTAANNIVLGNISTGTITDDGSGNVVEHNIT